MKLYAVSLPIVGRLETEILAESPESAINLALDKAYTEEAIEEWDIRRHIIEGNLCTAPLMSAKAKCIDEDPEEE